MTHAGEVAREQKRLAEIVAVFARYGLGEPFRDRMSRMVGHHLDPPDTAVSARSAPERLRLALTELGPTFVKLGQMLSLTPGLLPAEYAQELATLQEQVEPEPTATARQTIEHELGRSVDELYTTFGDAPLAAGSLGQVYRAELADGSVVAVKVQRDGIAQRVHVDLELISNLAGILKDHSDELRLYRPRELAARFRSRTLEELDFEREAQNAARFAANFADEPDVAFPHVYPELSSGRVLTLSLIEGTTFASLTPAARSVIDGKALGQRGAEIWLEMVFRDGFVHSDPHPGNLVVMSGSRLGIIDTGMVVRIDDRTREQFVELLDALVGGSSTDLAETLLDTCEHPSGVDTAGLAEDLDGLTATYLNRSLRSIDADRAIQDFAAVVHKHRLVLPVKISMLLQIMSELEGTSRLLDTDFHVMPLLESYWQKLRVEVWSPQAIEQRLTSAARSWLRRQRRLIDTIEVVGEQLRTGTFNVQVTHAGTDRVANRLVQGIIAAAFLLASSILWQARAAPVVDGVPLLAAIGLVVAVLLVAHVLFQIHRSEGG